MAASELQRRFVQEYLVDDDARAAALRAGYPNGEEGPLLLELDDVKECLEEERAALARRSQVDADWVIRQLKVVVERCMEYETVTAHGKPVIEIDGYGELRVLVKFNPQGATKALELIGKKIGMFVEKVETKDTTDYGDISRNEEARRVAHILFKALRAQQSARAEPDESTPRH